MEDEQNTSSATSLKDKLRQTLCLSCCFRNHNHNRPEALDYSPSSSSDDRPRLVRASSTWLKSRAQDLPEIRDKCRHLIGRIGRHHHHQRHSPSSEFKYDPLSYALNFDDDEAPLRNFSSRLPASPPLKTGDLVNPAVPREITCV